MEVNTPSMEKGGRRGGGPDFGVCFRRSEMQHDATEKSEKVDDGLTWVTIVCAPAAPGPFNCISPHPPVQR